jgi:hypothetical protein
MAQDGRLDGQSPRCGDHQLGEGAAAHVGLAMTTEDLIADLEVRHTRTDRINHAREILTKDQRKFVLQPILQVAEAGFPIHGIDAGGNHPNADFTSLRLSVLYLAYRPGFAKCILRECSHCPCPHMPSDPAQPGPVLTKLNLPRDKVTRRWQSAKSLGANLAQVVVTVVVRFGELPIGGSGRRVHRSLDPALSFGSMANPWLGSIAPNDFRHYLACLSSAVWWAAVDSNDIPPR